jgi:alpha/beta superfamily hydrolase
VPAVPWLIVQGDADELVNAQDTLDWIKPLANPPQVALLPGVEHFFHGKLNELREAVTSFART